MLRRAKAATHKRTAKAALRVRLACAHTWKTLHVLGRRVLVRNLPRVFKASFCPFGVVVYGDAAHPNSSPSFDFDTAVLHPLSPLLDRLYAARRILFAR